VRHAICRAFQFDEMAHDVDVEGAADQPDIDKRRPAECVMEAMCSPACSPDGMTRFWVFGRGHRVPSLPAFMLAAISGVMRAS